MVAGTHTVGAMAQLEQPHRRPFGIHRFLLYQRGDRCRLQRGEISLAGSKDPAGAALIALAALRYLQSIVATVAAVRGPPQIM